MISDASDTFHRKICEKNNDSEKNLNCVYCQL